MAGYAFVLVFIPCAWSVFISLDICPEHKGRTSYQAICYILSTLEKIHSLTKAQAFPISSKAKVLPRTKNPLCTR